MAKRRLSEMSETQHKIGTSERLDLAFRVKRFVMLFWRWVYLLAEKKSKEIHLDRHHNDIKCPRCKMWFSVSGLKYNHQFGLENELFIQVKCGQCGEVSNWSPNIAPVLIRVDDKGIPVEA
jgi:predicted Zn finger-like uncharacterized protein